MVAYTIADELEMAIDAGKGWDYESNFDALRLRR
jgi:hypothetical protein